MGPTDNRDLLTVYFDMNFVIKTIQHEKKLDRLNPTLHKKGKSQFFFMNQSFFLCGSKIFISR